MRLYRTDGVLVDDAGNEFNGMLPTAFLLCSPKYPWEFTKAYIDKMAEAGARGFRACWNVGWGPLHNGEHGGNTFYWATRDDLMLRTSQVLDYMKSKKMYLLLEMLDSSLYILIGQQYYARDQSWLDLFTDLVSLAYEHENLLIGTGNEPAKGKNADKVKDWQEWAINQLVRIGDEMGVEPILAGEINQGTGVPDLVFNPHIDVWGWKTPRWDNESVLQGTYDELRLLKLGKHPNILSWTGLQTERVIWGQEPPRRNYPAMGQWCSDTHKLWLTKLQYIHLGMLYTAHGLGHGQEEELPDDGNYMWGIGGNDWTDMWEGFNRFVSRIKSPPSGPASRTTFQFDLDTWFTGKGFGFVSHDEKHYICLAEQDGIEINLDFYGRFEVYDLFGNREWMEMKDPCKFTTTTVRNKLIYIRKGVKESVEE